MATINKTVTEINASLDFADELRQLKNPEQISKAAELFYSPEMFGVTVSDPTTSSNMVNAIAAAKSDNKALILGAGDYFIDPDQVSFADGEVLKIFGVGKEQTFIKSTGSGNSLFDISGNANIDFEGVCFSHNGFEVAIANGITTDETKPAKLTIKHCKIDVSGCSYSDGIKHNGYKSSVEIHDNEFVGNLLAPNDLEAFNLQALLALPDNGFDLSDKTRVSITFNKFIGGAFGYANFGSDHPVNPLFVNNNVFDSQVVRAIHLYHGVDWHLNNNTVKNCKCKGWLNRNNAGGAVWLDGYHPLSIDDPTSFSCYGNIVQDCKGVGVFAEEVQGAINGFNILNTTEFEPEDYYTSSEGVEFRGGVGVLITAGVRTISLDNLRCQNNVHDVMVDRTLGVDPTIRVTGVKINNPHFFNSKKESVVVRNRCDTFKILGGSIIGSGTETQGVYSAIKIDKDAGEADGPKRVQVNDVDFTDEISTVNAKHCIENSIPALNLMCMGNTFICSDEWIYSPVSTVANITGNRCYGNRGFEIQGGGKFYFNNEGYRTEYNDKIVVNGSLEYFHNLAQAMTNGRVVASIVNSGTDPVAVQIVNTLSTKITLRCVSLIDGSLDNIDREVVLNLSVSKSLV